jgi:transposase-like protein
MKASEFQVFLGQVAGLSEAQKATLLGVLAERSPGEVVRELLESKGGDQRQCPHCSGSHVVVWGSANGLHRYRCRDCGRTFNALTGTPLARLRYKETWLTFGEALQNADSVRKSAKACGVAVTTAFRWRHRFLRTAKADKPTKLGGIVEADETFFRRSYKGSRRWTRPQPTDASPSRPARHRGGPTGRRGTPLDEQVPVLIVRDRHRATGDAILDGLSAQVIGAHLVPMLSAEALLCTDTGAVYAVIARDAGIRHEPVNVTAEGYVRDRVFHIQNVNAYDSRLKQWMHRFNGVATRYLDSYLGWRRLIERLHENLNPQAIILSLT